MSESRRRGSGWWLVAELAAAAFLILAMIAPPEFRMPLFAAMGIAAVGGVVLVFLDGPEPID
ncbi:MAG TPA: hypothetical protein VMM18_03165 [Gemmatimonadaceae bacterium]|nr:hypothetical protein [Gemmatimonadaceae bacterium]